MNQFNNTFHQNLKKSKSKKEIHKSQRFNGWRLKSKNSYNQQFEKILCSLEKLILLIQNQEEDLIQKLDSAELIDVDEFVQFASKSNNSQLGYNQEFKSELQSKFLALTENNFVQNCIQSLSNVESITNEFQYKDDQSDLYLECEQNKNYDIILFDLSEKELNKAYHLCLIR